MKKILIASFVILFINACAVIPKETIILSENIGKDLQTLYSSHRNTIQLYYDKIKNNINTFIDDVYSPYIIHFALESELIEYKAGQPSLYTSILNAGTSGGKEETDNALNNMLNFYQAAIYQIDTKRNEILSPILEQEQQVLKAIDNSYQNALYANSTITAYLLSVRKIKESQDEALATIGLTGINDSTTQKLVELSTFMDQILQESKRIDLKSADAQKQIEEIVNKLKNN